MTIFQGPISFRLNAMRNTMAPANGTQTCAEITKAFAMVRAFGALYRGMGNFANHEARVTACLQLMTVDNGAEVTLEHLNNLCDDVLDTLAHNMEMLRNEHDAKVNTDTGPVRDEIAAREKTRSELYNKKEQIEIAIEKLEDIIESLNEQLDTKLTTNRDQHKIDLHIMKSQLQGMKEQCDEIEAVKNIFAIAK